MRSAALIFLLCGAISSVQGLKCVACQSATSFEECDVEGSLVECRENQESCETTVRRDNKQLLIWKGCKDATACASSEIQNFGRAGKSKQCNSDQASSVCTCCCKVSACNAGPPSCVKHYQRQNNTGKNCTQIFDDLPHGEIECYEHSGDQSICEYRCTGKDYSLYPPTRKHNVCRNNGSWAHEQPCCARPCPPYLLLDDLLLFHFSGENSEEALHFMVSDIAHGIVAEDAVKVSAMYYSGEPDLSSVIKFNEYGANKTRLRELAAERIQRVNEGPVNTGKALRYALDHLLTPESGMRDGRVKKLVNVVTNRNSDDDVKQVAEDLRNRGYQVNALIFETDEYTFDNEQLMQLTANKDHIFRFTLDGDNHAVMEAQLHDLIHHFCQNPCDHILHEHK